MKLRKHDKVSPVKPIPTDPTISLGEKIRTWRQRQIVNDRVPSARIEISADSRRAPRKTIDQVDFETPIQRMDRVVSASVGNLQQVRFLIVEMVDFFDLSSYAFSRTCKRYN